VIYIDVMVTRPQAAVLWFVLGVGVAFQTVRSWEPSSNAWIDACLFVLLVCIWPFWLLVNSLVCLMYVVKDAGWLNAAWVFALVNIANFVRELRARKRLSYYAFIACVVAVQIAATWLVTKEFVYAE